MVFTLSFLQPHTETRVRRLPRRTWSSGRGASDHSANSCGEFSVMATTRAPWDGGLDHVVLTIFSIWDRVLFRLSASRATTVRFPTRSSDETNTFERQLHRPPQEGDIYKGTTKGESVGSG